MQAQGVSLNAFIAHKLKRGNEAEVELGQMAVDRAKDESVKEFAQMMVKSHQQMIQKLEQFDTGAGSGASSREGAGRDSSNRDGQSPAKSARDNTSTTPVDGARNNVRNSESNTDTGTAQGTTTGNQSGQAGRAPIAGQNQPGLQGNQAGHGQAHMGGMSGHVPHMLVALTDQTCDNEQQLTKKMLEKHEGSDFDMAYIGQQIVAHNCMLAHLQALKSSGPQELQQLASQGEQETQKHLDKAMKIAEELGSKKK